MSYTKHGGFIIPGYAYPGNWSQPVGTAIPAQIAGIGGNWAVLQTSYSMTTTTDTAISSTTAVPDAGITAMVQAAKTAGLKVCLKPHVQASGDIAAHVLPGAFYTPNGAHYTNGQNTLNVPSANFDSSWIGRRVMNPNPGHYNSWPAGLNTLGTASPTWSVIQSVVDANNVTVSTNATESTPTSPGGSVAITDDTAVLTWFSNYQTILDHLMSVAVAAGGVDMVDLSTEHDFMTLVFDTQWRSLIAYMRSTYPGVQLTMGMGGNDGYGSVLCWNALDAIGITWYKNVQAVAGTEDFAAIDTNWKTYISGLAALSAAWSNKPILFSEIGYRSIVASGYQPYVTGQSVTVDQQAQWVCVQAFLRNVWNQPWFLGFHWWTWAHPQTTNPTGEISSYSPNSKLVETTFKQWFGAAPARLVTNGAGNYRR